ncbi:acetyl-CoA synthetase-like protein [Sarocladium strictum]
MMACPLLLRGFELSLNSSLSIASTYTIHRDTHHMNNLNIMGDNPERSPKAGSYRFRDDIGHRLLPHVVDELAESEPDHVLYEYPSDDQNLGNAWVKITAQQYANSINRTARWLEESLGRRPGTPTIGYEGPQDLRYLLLLIGAIKSGYRMLFTSPRNSLEGDLAVLKGADCNIWLLPSRGSQAQRLQDSIQLETVSLPDLAWFLDKTPVPHFEYEKSWAQGSREHAWILHTSGSTGNPKPVFRYLDSVASVGANNLLPKVNGRPLLLHDYYDTRVYLTFPFFHGAGLVNGMLWPVYHGTTIILGPQRPVTVGLIRDVIERTKPTSVFTAPSLVEEISKDPGALRLLETVKALAYGGGPVSLEAGNRIWQHTKLRLSIGTTEAGWMPCVETEPEDWNYIHPHPNDGFVFRPHSDDLYELIIVRQPELAQWQPIFSTFPNLQEYSTNDLWSKHPTKEGLYTYQGRADNIIVLSNGEKVQPNGMELTIGAHPLVKAAVVAGQGRFQTAVIIEVDDSIHPQTKENRRALIRDIWPSIEAGNKLSPTHARIHEDFIVISDPAKPFPRTPKATVRRGPVIKLYSEELDRIYTQAELGGHDNHEGPLLKLEDAQNLASSIQDIILSTTGLKSLEKTDDLFSTAGLDSLQVLAIRRKFVRSLPKDSGVPADDLSPALIYENPTVAKLATALLRLSEGGAASTNGADTGRTGLIRELFSKYTDDLPPRKDETPIQKYRVLLTGSTGSLGSYILDHLMESPTVEELWALNRSENAESKQTQLNQQRGLRTDFAASNVHFLHARLDEKFLGLPEATYEDIASRSTHIIDVRWQVDFNLSLASFESNIKGVRHLVDLAHKGSNATKTIRYLFTSSIGVANRQSNDSDSTEEKPLDDYEGASSGYGESKLLAENILLEAARKSGVGVTICRVGQIAGPVRERHKQGAWTRKEWLPTLIDASTRLSLLPSTLGRNETTDWIPVDLLSSIIFEMATGKGQSAGHSRILHAVNPQKAQWNTSVLPVACNSLEAVKLLPFFKGLLSGGQGSEFKTTEAVAISPTLRELPAVGADWTTRWLEQWGYTASL